MTRFTRWLGFLALALAAGCGKQEAKVVKPRATLGEEVEVWVDGAGITGIQIQQEAGRLFAKVAKDLPPEEKNAIQGRVLNQAIENLVVRQLVRAEMERSGVVITREEIEQGKKDLEAALGPSGSLMMLLADANVPLEEMEMNLQLDLFKNRMIKDRLQAALAEITEETARKFYADNAETFKQPAGRLVSHILVRVRADADEATKTDARAKAEGIRQQLREGADFAKLAAEVSECMSRARGGDLGVIPRGREAPAFEAAVYSQEIGVVGEVVESPVGFHVIQVTGEQEEKMVPFDQVKDRLLIGLKNEMQQRLANEYIAGLREKATIKFDGVLAQNAEVQKAPPAADAAPADAAPEAGPGPAPAESAPETAAPADAAPVP